MNNYGIDSGLSMIKKEKLNFKKVIIFILIMLMSLGIIYVSFYISYTKMNSIELDEIYEEKNINLDKKQNKKENTVKLYKGNHIQISKHDVESIKLKFVPNANPNAQQQIRDIYFSEEKQVYLTFDDGPSKDITPQILDILKDEDVVATFFVLGARVDLYPETLIREYEEGHYIANHGYSHQYSSIYQSKDSTFQEYVDCENSIKKALNNPEYNTFLFRFPGGSSGGTYSTIKAEARELFNNYGIAHTNWNCLTGDAAGKKTKEDCYQEMINTKGNQNSIILLMHDANDKQYTVDALRDVIHYFKNDGYTFKNFYEIFK